MQNYDQACVDTQYCQLRLISTGNNENIYLYNIFTIGSAWMVASFDGVVQDASAWAHTVEVIHPFLSAINAWI